MPKKSIKYRRIIGSIFLAAYMTFILVGTVHFHHYDLNPANNIAASESSGGTSDLNMDFFSVCSLHQFSQSIDNISHNSADISQKLSGLQTDLFPRDVSIFIPEIHGKISPRAPPAALS